MKVFTTCVTLSAILLALCNLGFCEEELTRKCLDTDRHKPSPSEEKERHPVCSHWEGKVCCLKETTEKINHSLADHFHMNQHLCKNKALSKPCMAFFQKDACLYECSPDIWAYGNITDANGDERVKSVPLCESDCKDWFNACAKDMTCSSNWTTQAHKGNHSSNDSACTHCETIEKKFGTAKNFCQMVWDHAYEVVKDDAKCISLKGSIDTKPVTTTEMAPTANSGDTIDQKIPEIKRNETDDGGKSSSSMVIVNKSFWFVLLTFRFFYTNM